MLKPNIWFNTQKRREAKKNCDKGGKALYKLMNNAVYGKKKGNRIDVKLVNNEKDYLQWHQNQAIWHKKYLKMT